jgi:hypothetical protein
MKQKLEKEGIEISETLLEQLVNISKELGMADTLQELECSR